MNIDSSTSAREFVRAWTGHSGATRAYRMAAESQRTCAILSGPNQVQASRHLAAAAVLERAAQSAPSVCPQCGLSPAYRYKLADPWDTHYVCPDCGHDYSVAATIARNRGAERTER